MLLQSDRIQVRKTCRNFFCQTSEKFLLKLGIYLVKKTLKKNLLRNFLLTGKIQFGQTCRKISCIMAAKGLSNIKSDSKRRNVSKKNFRILFFWTGRMQFWRRGQKLFRKKSKTFQQRVWKFWKIKIFPPKKNLFSKRCSEEVECRCGNPAGSFSANGRKIFTQSPKVNLKK